MLLFLTSWWLLMLNLKLGSWSALYPQFISMLEGLSQFWSLNFRLVLVKTMCLLLSPPPNKPTCVLRPWFRKSNPHSSSFFWNRQWFSPWFPPFSPRRRASFFLKPSAPSAGPKGQGTLQATKPMALPSSGRLVVVYIGRKGFVAPARRLMPGPKHHQVYLYII